MPAHTTRWFADGTVAVHGAWGAPDAPAVMLIHGAGFDHRFWGPLTGILDRPGRTTMAIDLPGHGASRGSTGGGIAARAGAVEAVLDQHDPGAVTLVGHSMGAIIALDVAARRPDRVDRTVLLGTGADMRVKPEVLAALRSGDGTMLDRWIGWLFKRGDDPDRLAVARDLVLAVGLDVLVADLEAVTAWTATPERARVLSVGSLVVSGTRDRMTPPDDGRRLAELLPVATFALVDDGHMFPRTSPRETARMVEAFVTDARR